MKQIKFICRNFISLMLVMFVFVGALGIHSSAAKGTNMLGNCEPYYITNASLENFSMGGTEYKDGFKCRVAYDRHCELAFNLGQNYTSVSFDVGHIDGTAAGSSEIKLTILGDGEELTVLPLNNSDIPKFVSLNVAGISQLTLVLRSHRMLSLLTTARN